MAKQNPKDNVYDLSKVDIKDGGVLKKSDPIVHWFTQEGSKRGRRNLMWDICMGLYQEFEDIHEKREKLRTDEEI